MASSSHSRSSLSSSSLHSLAITLFIMHFFSVAVAALSATQLVLGDSPVARSPYAVKETHFVPNKWSKIGTPHPDHLVNLKIAMKNTRFHELEKHLYEVSDPRHERYGQHLTSDEVDELVKPSEKASHLVDQWLDDYQISPHMREYSSGKQWITVTLPVSHVELLLQTKYAVYQHQDGDTLVRTTSWSLPEHLHEYIATIQPTTVFMRSSPQLDTAKVVPESYTLPELQLEMNGDDVASACNFSLVTPNCLRTLYKTKDYKPKAPTKNQIGFTNYLGQVTSRNDTAQFLQTYRPDAVSGAYAYKEISIASGPLDNGTNTAGTEAELDQQTIIGQVFPMNVTSYSTGGSPPFIPDLSTPSNTNEPYLTWLNYFRSQKSPPQTISTSYGDDEQTIPYEYAKTVCQGFAELGVRGVTLLFSSGDNGVGKDDACFSNDGKNTSKFLPSFPASCPYITSVGATRDFPEVVAYDDRNGYVSGAGFSDYFTRPFYQALAVRSYVSSLDGKLDGLYNKHGRAYPDLAAQGYRYAVVAKKRVIAVDGTSASCPATSSIIALVNDALIAAGRPSLGFMNPWLYFIGGRLAFTDVVNGTTTGCNTAGFPAAKGWDAASGWGTPDFVKILKVLGLEH